MVQFLSTILSHIHTFYFLLYFYLLIVCWVVYMYVCFLLCCIDCLFVGVYGRVFVKLPCMCVGTALHCTRSKCIQGNIKLDIKTKLQFNFVWTVEFCWRAGTVCAWDVFTTRQGNRNSFVFGFQLHYITRCCYYTIKGFSN